MRLKLSLTFSSGMRVLAEYANHFSIGQQFGIVDSNRCRNWNFIDEYCVNYLRSVCWTELCSSMKFSFFLIRFILLLPLMNTYVPVVFPNAVGISSPSSGITDALYILTLTWRTMQFLLLFSLHSTWNEPAISFSVSFGDASPNVFVVFVSTVELFVPFAGDLSVSNVFDGVILSIEMSLGVVSIPKCAHKRLEGNFFTLQISIRCKWIRNAPVKCYSIHFWQLFFIHRNVLVGYYFVHGGNNPIRFVERWTIYYIAIALTIGTIVFIAIIFLFLEMPAI